MSTRNPFQYEAASKLTPEDVVQYYVADHNYTRFICSKRNILLVGDRGSGKSMALRYHSLPIQALKNRDEENKSDLSFVCIHVPCNAPLMHKRDIDLVDGGFHVATLGEHFLVVSILVAMCQAFDEAGICLEEQDSRAVKDRLQLLWDADLDIEASADIWDAIVMWCQIQLKNAQRALNGLDECCYRDTLSFVSGVVPFMESLRRTGLFSDTHFSIMLDDVQDLSKAQIEVANSWLAYRDNSLFSFKVACTKSEGVRLKTASGGQIIEGHDFTRIDMEGEYQNKQSKFGKLAREIISRRLGLAGCHTDPERFFPVNDVFSRDLECATEKARKDGTAKGLKGKALSDHVYKYGRACYFRQRSGKANTPRSAYTGLETLVQLSTGIIRNLLEPCYWMYDRSISEQGHDEARASIRPNIQSDVILELSRRKWKQIAELPMTGLCSEEEAKALGQLLDGLAGLFRERLEKHESEPRAIKFYITGTSFEKLQQVIGLLEIAQRSQLLYTYESSGRELGKRRTYYVPNRMLWPVRSLDPCGQHAAVSIRADRLWQAAYEGKRIPMSSPDATEHEAIQRRLFDDE